MGEGVQLGRTLPLQVQCRGLWVTAHTRQGEPEEALLRGKDETLCSTWAMNRTYSGSPRGHFCPCRLVLGSG